MTAENQAEKRGTIEFPNLRVGRIDLYVSDLDAEVIGRDGKILKPSNLSEPNIQEKIRNLLESPQYKGFVEGIESGEKMAFAAFKAHRILSIFVISVGVTAAVAAYEFGIRHGEDVRKVINIFKPKEETKPTNADILVVIGKDLVGK